MSFVSAFVLVTFYFFSAIAIVLGLMSLRGGVRFARYVRRELEAKPADYTPLVSVFVPCRGLEQSLRENIDALFAQDYPEFEIIFVSDRPDDPAFAVIEEARRSFRDASGPTIQFVISGPATDCGQKAHNLSVAVEKTDRVSEVFVFVDTDARPQQGWLRALVRPLSDETVGAATGYRWFVPARGGFTSHLRSVWNASIASALGADEHKNFCWGGSTAIRRTTFGKTRVLDYWRGAVSDDFAMTRALHDAQLKIKFVPQCLVPSFEECSLPELFEFTTRQLRITRVYAPHLWRAVLIGSSIFTIAFFGGLALTIVRAAEDFSFALPLFLVLLIFAMGAAKAHLRLRAVSHVIADQRTESLAATVAHSMLWPVASLLFLFNAIMAAISRRISWRGITYELKSPNEAVIIQKQESGVGSRESA